MTAPALRIAMLVGNLTDAIAAVQSAIGIEDTRKLLVRLAGGLGAPEPDEQRAPLSRPPGG